MKTNNFIWIGIVFATVLFAACEKGEMNGLMDESTKSVEMVNGEPEFTTTINDLSEVDKVGLLLMREEEKMAHDVYVYFFGKYNLTVFERIAESEAQHASAVLALLEHFEIADPASDKPGVFKNPAIQSLYNQLIAAGSATQEALKTGAYIEEYDIVDLQHLIGKTKNADIVRVYSNLLRGSENHLRAFTRSLFSLGLTYEPQILSVDEYEAILVANTNTGKGSMNRKDGRQGVGAQNGGAIHQNDSTVIVCDSTGTGATKSQARFNFTRNKSGRP
jgi:hypothetical protein